MELRRLCRPLARRIDQAMPHIPRLGSRPAGARDAEHLASLRDGLPSAEQTQPARR